MAARGASAHTGAADRRAPGRGAPEEGDGQMTSGQPPADTSTHGLGADDDRLHLPSTLDPDRVYDVLLNGRHVWSLQPRRDARGGSTRPSAPWPRTLKR